MECTLLMMLKDGKNQEVDKLLLNSQHEETQKGTRYIILNEEVI